MCYRAHINPGKERRFKKIESYMENVHGNETMEKVDICMKNQIDRYSNSVISGKQSHYLISFFDLIFMICS